MAKGKREHRNTQPGGMGFAIAAVIVGVLLVGAFGFCVYVHNASGIFPGVTLEGLELGGMQPMEAADALRASGIGDREDVTLTVTLPEDNLLVIDAKKAGAIPDASALARTAYEYGREQGFIGSAVTYVKSALFGAELSADSTGELDEGYIRSMVKEAAQRADEALMGSNMEIKGDTLILVKGVGQVLVDEDVLCTGVMSALQAGDFTGFAYTPELKDDGGMDMEQLYETVHREVKNAEYDKEEGILPHVTGVDFDLENAVTLWNKAEPGEEIRIPLTVTEPEVTEEFLQEHLFADVLGERSSSLTTSSANRVNNVERACASIDGTVLMPGEEFSYNTALGKRTEAAGYKPAGAYLNGEVVTEIGGGICQVSSTLYCAAMLSNLKITARTNHYFGVDYLPAGLDATVSWGGPEFKFVNNREYPVKIQAAVDREKWNMSVSILGTDTDGSYVRLTTSTWAMEGGYGATSYRWVYDAEGNLLSKTEEATSRYHYHEEKEDEEEKPEETPEVSPSPSPEVTPAPSTDSDIPSPSPEVSPSPEPSPEVSPSPEPTPFNPGV